MMADDKVNIYLNVALLGLVINLAGGLYCLFGCQNGKKVRELEKPVPIVRVDETARTESGLELIADMSEPEIKVAEPVERKGLVVLDPGHGYDNKKNGLYDPGACINTGGYEEARVVLGQAEKVKEILEEKGYEVVLTRNNNEISTSLDSRLPLAKDLGADVFVSLHCNASENSNANGVQTFYGGDSSKRLAEIVHASVFNQVRTNGRQDLTDRGVVKEPWRVLDDSTTSIMVETGFLTNAEDREYLTDSVNDVEQGIADGIDAYLSSKN